MKLSSLLALALGCLFLGCATSAPVYYEDVIDIQKIKEWLEHKDDERNKAEKRKLLDDDDVPKPGELFEGDIVMDQDLRNDVLGKADKRSALRSDRKLWPNAILPFVFEDSVSSEVREHILDVMKDFKRYTCIRLVPRKNEESYIIIRTHPSSCSSYVGRRRPDEPQHVTLAHGCMRRGTILHELLHALGVVHEQSRPDRDDYIEILWRNIRKKERNNFRKYKSSLVADYGVKYNFNSIMHYGPFAFSSNGDKTIVPRADTDVHYGQRKAFSTGDVATINRLYKCGNHYSKDGLLPSDDGEHLQYSYPDDDD